jgi:hypothetical protein
MSGSGGVWLITQVANEKSKNAKVKMQNREEKAGRAGPTCFGFHF